MSSVNDLLLGALLAISGGFIGDEIRSWRQRMRECDSIKICLADELKEIEATTSNMHQVWETAQVFHPNYVTELLASTSAYDNLRPRLFLIKNDTLRKEIGDFYKKLKDMARKAEGKIGTLAQTEEATTDQANFDSAFQALAVEAKTVRQKLENKPS